MNTEEYKEKGKQVVDYIGEYLDNIRDRRVFPDVVPGYMRELLPSEAPNQGEKWEDIFNDIERVIMPGITHWQSPHMHAYFPALNSYPSLLGDMIAEAINCLGFTWAASPAATELEALVLDWLVKSLGLPEKFLNSNQEPYGGGALQTTASEATYYALLAARTKIFNKYGVGEVDKYIEKSEINGRLVCYCSDQAHSSVEKAALIAITRIRLLPSDEKLSLRGDTLRKAIEQDKKDGLIPFYVCATLGTTGACAFDNLEEIGPICQAEDIWLHIDAAYAGSALICPEFRKFAKGLEYATSFVFNPSKWLMVNFDCTCFWVESSVPVHQTFTVAPLYLKHKYSGAAIDYMHWQVGLSRRFRALKIWIVIRSFGMQGLQRHILKSVELAKIFERLVRDDDNFEIVAERHLGLVVFRLKGENEITELLLKNLNKDGRLHVVPAKVKDKYIIRFTVTSFNTTEEDIKRDWEIIKCAANQLLHTQKSIKEAKNKFQSSLILSNVSQTPKIVNASFMAFYQENDAANDIAKELTSRGYMSSHLPLTPRRKPRFLNQSAYKGLSFDYPSYLSPKMILNELFLDKNNESKTENENNKESNKQQVQQPSNNLNGSDSEIDLIIRKKLQSVLMHELNETEKEETENNGNNGNNNNNNKKYKKKDISKFLVKRSSLDSKIEYIFEEVDDVEQQTQPSQSNGYDEFYNQVTKTDHSPI